MPGFVVWGAFSVVVAVCCWWRPQGTRVLVGGFFALMGLGVHGTLVATDPQGYVDFAADAPWAPYRDLGLWLVEPSPLAFGLVMLVFEVVTAALILGRGRSVRWGLLAAVVFLVGIVPLGLEEVPNLVLAAGLLHLRTQDFPEDAWTVLRRRHPRQRHPGQARDTTPAGGLR